MSSEWLPPAPSLWRPRPCTSSVSPASSLVCLAGSQQRQTKNPPLFPCVRCLPLLKATKNPWLWASHAPFLPPIASVYEGLPHARRRGNGTGSEAEPSCWGDRSGKWSHTPAEGMEEVHPGHPGAEQRLGPADGSEQLAGQRPQQGQRCAGEGGVISLVPAELPGTTASVC